MKPEQQMILAGILALIGIIGFFGGLFVIRLVIELGKEPKEQTYSKEAKELWKK